MVGRTALHSGDWDHERTEVRVHNVQAIRRRHQSYVGVRTHDDDGADTWVDSVGSKSAPAFPRMHVGIVQKYPAKLSGQGYLMIFDRLTSTSGL